MADIYHFQIGFTGTVDRNNAVIRGVSLITGKVTAEGHDLEVDDTTLQQVLMSAKKTGQVPVKLDHGSGVKEICGFLDNFSIDGDKVRGDWHLLKSHEETEKMLERAERMPGCFGLSVAFKGKGVPIKGGKKAARCEKLMAVDCVTQPAANPDGLFSAVVDTSRRGMDPNDPTKTGAEPTIADVVKMLGAINQRLDAQEQFNQSLIQSMNEPSLEELDAMSDEELEALGLTRAEVDAAVAEAIAGGEGEEAGEHAGAGAGGGEGGAVASALSALQREIVQLKSQRAADIQFAEQQEADHAFAVVESKVIALAAQNKELIELNGKLEAENEALRVAVKTGAKHVAPGGEAVTLFSAKGAKPGSFEVAVTAEFEALKAKGNMTELKARSEAVKLCVKRHPEAYREYRARGGKIELSAQR
jgi:uncharacterized protein YjiS (DUF1127 family)